MGGVLPTARRKEGELSKEAKSSLGRRVEDVKELSRLASEGGVKGQARSSPRVCSNACNSDGLRSSIGLISDAMMTASSSSPRQPVSNGPGIRPTDEQSSESSEQPAFNMHFQSISEIDESSTPERKSSSSSKGAACAGMALAGSFFGFV